MVATKLIITTVLSTTACAIATSSEYSRVLQLKKVDVTNTKPNWMDVDKEIERCFPIAFSRSMNSTDKCESFCANNGADGVKFTARISQSGNPLRVAYHDCHCYDMLKCKELKGNSRNFHDNHYFTTKDASLRGDAARRLRGAHGRI